MHNSVGPERKEADTGAQNGKCSCNAIRRDEVCAVISVDIAACEIDHVGGDFVLLSEVRLMSVEEDNVLGAFNGAHMRFEELSMLMVMLFARSSTARSSVRFRHIHAGLVKTLLVMFANLLGVTSLLLAAHNCI